MIADLPEIRRSELKGGEKIPACNKDGKIIGFMPINKFLIKIK